jgi:D-3-phosphoglycerate dehydrogenase/(S)-sulfolactate dehydrogenase
VLAFDPKIDDAKDPGISLTSIEELLEQSDVVTLHTRLTSETAHLIDARALARMKRGAYLVNTARGEVVDQQALIAALTSGALGGAALDTYEDEPLAADSELRRLANVVLSPHVAGQTSAALVRVAISAAQAILDDFAGLRPKHVYNPQAYDVRAARDGAWTTTE